MAKKLPAKIGNVKISPLSLDIGKNYADAAEDTLLELFSSHDTEIVASKRREILSDNPSWPLYYHLSPVRSNLLRWYEFTPKARIFEVGAGCGAITEELVRRNVDVVALELTQKRSLINAHRNHYANNLEVVIGNLDSYKPAKKFDYIVCVGVLEYAGTFFRSDSPYEDFLKTLSSFMKDKGTLLLAIENRLGLKYWAGATEDHSRTFFEGHNGYPNRKGIQTFGKKELKSLLCNAGFKETTFFYPYPDYKTPFFVYTEDYYPGNGATFPLGRLPTPALDRPRHHLFSEQNTMRYLEANDLFPDFSNSFLVEARL